MRTLAAASCTVLVLASCAPEKGGGVDAVVRMDAVRMDDGTRLMVTALSDEIRTGFELGSLRQSTFGSPLASVAGSPAWASYAGSVTGKGASTESQVFAVSLTGRPSSRHAAPPFRFRSKDRAAPGGIRGARSWRADSEVVASRPVSVLRHLMMPVVGIEASALRDTYGAARHGHRIHGAIDIHAPLGTPVVASLAGTIWKIRWDAGGGRTVHLLDSSGKYVFYYAHLSRYAKGLREGQTVQRGDLLGYVGKSGDVVGSPHLHLRIGSVPADREHWWDVKPLNPYPLLKSASTVLP